MIVTFDAERYDVSLCKVPFDLCTSRLLSFCCVVQY